MWSSRNARPRTYYSSGSGFRAWWVCPLGHEWQAVIKNITRGDGCPVCSGRRVLAGFNDLASTHPELASQWADKELTPQEVTYGSTKSVGWVCPLGHEWSASPNSRTNGSSGCPVCSGKVVLKGFNDLQTHYPKVYEELETKGEYTKHSGQRVWWLCSQGHRWYAKIADRTILGSGCPTCSHGQVSLPETDLAEFVSGLAGTETRTRSIIPPKELDIYIPPNLAIEHNGLYWHSEERVGRLAHYEKWQQCKARGIQLITIWGDDWEFNRSVVERLIESKIKSRKTIGARHTHFVHIPPSEAKEFLTRWHIQGARSGRCAGLTYQGELVAVAVVNGKSLDRYASSMSIVGGLDKILKNIGPGVYQTFADHAVSDGGIYEKTGWTAAKELPPDYQYIVGRRREHKFSYRKHRFKTDENLVYEDGKTEEELAQMNSLSRIWDCGKTKYIKEY